MYGEMAFRRRVYKCLRSTFSWLHSASFIPLAEAIIGFPRVVDFFFKTSTLSPHHSCFLPWNRRFIDKNGNFFWNLSRYQSPSHGKFLFITNYIFWVIVEYFIDQGGFFQFRTCGDLSVAKTGHFTENGSYLYHHQQLSQTTLVDDSWTWWCWCWWPSRLGRWTDS